MVVVREDNLGDKWLVVYIVFEIEIAVSLNLELLNI